MELRQLRYAVAVAETGHFGRAAERLRIAQSGLSQQIKALERSLGTPLFRRDTRNVTMTPAGEVFLEHARMVLELADRAERSVRLLEKGKVGLIKVATNSAGNPPAMSDALKRFREKYPDVEVELYPGLSPQNLEALRQRRVDLANVVLPFESTEVPNYLHLGWIELVVVVPESHRLASLDRIPRNELTKQPFLTLPRSVNPRLIDHMHDLLFEGRERRLLVEAIDIAAAARIAQVAEDPTLIGVGFGYEAELDAPGVVFRRLEAPMPRIEYGLVWLDVNASPLVERFVASARDAG